MKSNFFVIILVIVIIGGAVYLFSGDKEDASITEESNDSETPSLGVPALGNEDVEEMIVVSDEESDDGASMEESESQEVSTVVVYNDSGYSPRTLSISAGTTVVFRNDSSQPMWTASAFHPTHTSYPNSGISKCDEGDDPENFDACGSVEGGGEWSFTFNEAGSWGYHNHVRASHNGTIVVE
jgi:plastocyanin